MNFILGAAIVTGAVVAVFCFATGFSSGASGKTKKSSSTRFLFPPGLGESDTKYDYYMFDLDDGTTKFEYEFDQRHNDVIAAGLFDPDKKSLKLECFEDLIGHGLVLENRTEPCESRDDAQEAFHNYLRGF